MTSVPPPVKVRLTVNGEVREAEVPSYRTLVDLLRYDLGLTGTKETCGVGVCGACTVNVDGDAIRSCLMFAVQVNGRNVTTIEGIAGSDKNLHPIQEAFRNQHGLQCGFCTPGMIITLEAFLKQNPDPTELEIRQAISGNICRCTGYQSIVAATLEAAKILKQRG